MELRQQMMNGCFFALASLIWFLIVPAHVYCNSSVGKHSIEADNWASAAGANPPNSGITQRLEASLSHKSSTFIFMAAVVLGLAFFMVTYCIAYFIWSIILRQGLQRNQQFSYGTLASINNMNHEQQGNHIINHNVGLDASLLSSFPILQYTEESSRAMSTDQSLHIGEQNVIVLWVKECAVCLSEFDAGEEMKVLPVCGHCFHKSCIDMWLFSHSTCPICRLSLIKQIHGE